MQFPIYRVTHVTNVVSDYEHCLHTEHTGQKRLVRPVEKPSNNAVNEDNLRQFYPALSLLFICADIDAKNKVTISEETHLNILSVLDNMN